MKKMILSMLVALSVNTAFATTDDVEWNNVPFEEKLIVCMNRSEAEISDSSIFKYELAKHIAKTYPTDKIDEALKTVKLKYDALDRIFNAAPPIVSKKVFIEYCLPLIPKIEIPNIINN